MDLRMPDGDGVAAIPRAPPPPSGHRPRGSSVLTTYDTDSDAVAAIEAGATGYLLKDAPTEALVAAIRATAAGETRALARRREPTGLARARRWGLADLA